MYELQGSLAMMSFDPSKGINPQGGKTFYVHETNGNDDNEGTDPQFPLSSLEEAYNKCVAAKGDYIFVEYFSTLSAPPLTIEKRTIHLIALSSGNFDSRNDLNGGTSVSLVMTADGRDFELAGFNLGGDSPAANYALEAPAIFYRSHIHHCTFGHNFAATDGMHILELSHSVIDHCLFSNMLTGYGIYVDGVVDSMIANNIFLRIPEKCIYVITGAVLLSIFGNMFLSLPGDDKADGWAIDLAAGCTSGLVMGNRASQKGASSFNPYRDHTGDNLNNIHFGWSDNHDGIALSTTPKLGA